jgi:hypothetical protein
MAASNRTSGTPQIVLRKKKTTLAGARSGFIHIARIPDRSGESLGTQSWTEALEKATNELKDMDPERAADRTKKRDNLITVADVCQL